MYTSKGRGREIFLETTKVDEGVTMKAGIGGGVVERKKRINRIRTAGSSMFNIDVQRQQ